MKDGKIETHKTRSRSKLVSIKVRALEHSSGSKTLVFVFIFNVSFLTDWKIKHAKRKHFSSCFARSWYITDYSLQIQVIYKCFLL